MQTDIDLHCQEKHDNEASEDPLSILLLIRVSVCSVRAQSLTNLNTRVAEEGLIAEFVHQGLPQRASGFRLLGQVCDSSKTTRISFTRNLGGAVIMVNGPLNF